MTEWAKVVYEKIKLPFIELVMKLNLTANQITILNHAITLTFGCYFFSRGTWLFYLCGLSICLLNGLLDYLDGDIARIRKEASGLGNWLDTGFDVIIQNAVLGAIGVGCYKQGLPLFVLVMFFIGNSANNFVSFHYNQKFGFESDKGNESFRLLMDKKPTLFNIIIKEMIDPTCCHRALFLYTYRYWIAIGALTGNMVLCFKLFTLIANIKWFVMYVVYAEYIRGNKSAHVFKVLRKLDNEQSEYYRLQNS